MTSLRIDKCIISVSLLAEHCPQLKEFYVDDVYFTEEQDGVQVTFPCLIKCTFTKMCHSSTKALCMFLSSSPKLESVSFILCRLSLTMKNQILMLCKTYDSSDMYDSLYREIVFKWTDYNSHEDYYITKEGEIQDF